MSKTLEIVKAISGAHTFVVQPKRWIVERTFGWLGRYRRLSEDYEELADTSESMFGSRFELLLYDVTSTYFEGQCQRNPQAQRGYSRGNRPDCKQVCIGLVVTAEGLPLAYEVFAGNRADVTTVEDIIDFMERKHGRAERIWAMDRGMVSEDNLDYLRERDAPYIVGTPKGRLRTFEQQLLEQADWQQVQEGVEVKLVDHPARKGTERYVLCRSEARHEKESAMLRRHRFRYRSLVLTAAALQPPFHQCRG